MELAMQNSVLKEFIDGEWFDCMNKPSGLQHNSTQTLHDTAVVHEDEDGSEVRSECSSTFCKDHGQDHAPWFSDSDLDHRSISTRGTASNSCSFNSSKDSGSSRSYDALPEQQPPTDDQKSTTALKEFETRRIFDTYDENRDGQISKAELGNCMKKLDLHITEDAISTMMSSADINGDGSVDYQEFVALHTSMSNSTSHSLALQEDDDDDKSSTLKEAFSVFDKNDDGYITATELKSILNSLGIKKGATLKECQQMISGVDRNGDGRVDFKEFKELMTDLP